MNTPTASPLSRQQHDYDPFEGGAMTKLALQPLNLCISADRYPAITCRLSIAAARRGDDGLTVPQTIDDPRRNTNCESKDPTAPQVSLDRGEYTRVPKPRTTDRAGVLVPADCGESLEASSLPIPAGATRQSQNAR